MNDNVRLQRSRVLSNAEGSTQQTWRTRVAAASTKPRSFERGRSPRRDNPIVVQISFNEAAFFRTRKEPFVYGRFVMVTRFNEAAFFRTRKVLGRSWRFPAARRFNEAAFFRTRKATPDRSMGPRWLRFNEAAFFRTRKATRTYHPQMACPCFNEAAFFRTRKEKGHPLPILDNTMLQRSRVLSNAEGRSTGSLFLWQA